MIKLSTLPALLCFVWFASPAEAREPEPARLLGQVYSADGRGIVGLRAFFAGAGGDTVWVSVAGDFELPLPSGTPALELVIEPQDQVEGDYHPVLAVLDSGEIADGVRVVLIPRRWPVPTGTFAGRTVEISMDRAYTPACRNCPSYYRQGIPRPPHNRVVNPESWPASAFPIRVAFDRQHSRAVITPRDSALFWSSVRQMESEFGEQLFQPVTYTGSLAQDGEDVDDVILVSIEPTIPGQGYGSSVSQHGDIFYGAVRMRTIRALNRPEGQRIVTHELMHALGIGHTCGWRSVMAQIPACSSRSSSTLSAEDVSYAQVLMRVRELQKAYGATIGIEAALAGERALLGRS